MPRRYKVVIYNDDFTIPGLRGKSSDYSILQIGNRGRNSDDERHKSGSAVVGIYSYDIALSKVRKATDMAREEGFPLKLTVLPEDKQA